MGASTDDCWRAGTPSTFDLTGGDLYAGDYTSSVYDDSGGMRFLNVTIGQGDTIDAASMQFRAVGSVGTIPTLYLDGEDVDDAATFTTSGNYDGRARTTAAPSWTPGAWSSPTWYTTSEIKTVIQEIVDRGGWAGASLVMFWRDPPGWGGTQGYIYADSYDRGAAIAPKLDIDYSAPAGVTVTPPTLALVLTTFVPTVTATANVLVTPPTLALSITAFIPTVTATDSQSVTPPTLALSLTTYIPTIGISDNQLATPPSLALSLTTFVPTIEVSDNQLVTPPKLALVITTFVPTVTATADVIATPPKIALTLTTYVPTVTTTGNVVVTPTTLALVLAAFAPTVSTPIVVTPPKLALILTTFAPTVSIGDASVTVTPPTLALVLTTFIPVISVFATAGAPFLYTAANWDGGLEVYLEAYFRAVSGTARARLWNDTDGVPVADSEISTTVTDLTRLRSGAISLTDGKTYFAQFGTDGGSSSGAYKAAKIIVF